MAGIKGAIFDLDGTLFDSMGIWDDVDRAFFHLHGREMPSGYVDALNAMSFSEGAEYTRALIGYELTADEIIAEWHSLSIKLYAEDVRLKPGAEELLESLSSSGISLAIATDLDEELALPAVKKIYFYVIISSDYPMLACFCKLLPQRSFGKVIFLKAFYIFSVDIRFI